MSSDACPAILKTAWKGLQKYIQRSDLASNSDLHTLGDIDAKPTGSYYDTLDSDIHRAFTTLLQQSRYRDDPIIDGLHVLRLPRHYLRDVEYTNFNTALNHSLIYFYPDQELREPMKAGQIRDIFRHRRFTRGQTVTEVFYAVHEYRQCKENPFSPYQNF